MSSRTDIAYASVCNQEDPDFSPQVYLHLIFPPILILHCTETVLPESFSKSVCLSVGVQPRSYFRFVDRVPLPSPLVPPLPLPQFQ